MGWHVQGFDTSKRNGTTLLKGRRVLAPNGIIEVVNIPFLGNSLVMDTDALAKQVQEEEEKGRRIMAIVGIAGETETGLIEDLDRDS